MLFSGVERKNANNSPRASSNLISEFTPEFTPEFTKSPSCQRRFCYSSNRNWAGDDTARCWKTKLSTHCWRVKRCRMETLSWQSPFNLTWHNPAAVFVVFFYILIGHCTNTIIMLFNFSTGGEGIFCFEVLWWKKCLDAVGSRWQFQTMGKKFCCFFLQPQKSEGKGREVGTTITIIPCVHIILCTPLTNADVVVELKWWMKQVAREKQDFENVDAPANFKPDVKKHFGFHVSRTEKREMVTI